MTEEIEILTIDLKESEIYSHNPLKVSTNNMKRILKITGKLILSLKS